MKKYLITAGLLLLGFVSNSQVIISLLLGDKLNTGKIEFGLEGGLNWSTIKNLDGAKGLLGFNLGFYFDFKLKNTLWMLNTGVIVKSPMGAEGLPLYSLNDPKLDSAFVGGSVTRKLRYFNVPVMMKYKFKNNLFVKGGVQLGLRSKCFDEFINSVIDDDDLKYKIKTKDQFHPLDAGLAIGVGYRLMKGNGMNFGLQYYYGLIDITIDDATASQYNRNLYLTFGIPIGVGKKNATQNAGK
jgi:hypothetical protein